MGEVIILLLLGALAGGWVGWAARREDTRRYRESRERYWAARLAEALAELESARSVPAAPAAVVHVHVTAPTPMPQVIDAEVVRAPPGEVAWWPARS